ncbi:division inhibitor protein [Catenovulum agarivorans DS-2]|uniref:Nucleoid occlusion factor SlmA n=1 Tax=Catenovulum agarivorans DS-2 TaxID=1328313 RepID=W7QS14_9ALTE|nr:nucleoid occlusion factor SlmA [Catenovulum agarivorans]EWH10638.1 division inhibitor protein [Catenovulum agarivorans DS-2]
MNTKRGNRKQEILQALANMLETKPGERITTARLAEAVGVTEAALYRHFPSKARMFEGLLDFAEDTLFTRINKILEEDKQSLGRCLKICQLVLLFTEKNPGISRLLTGDALMGEQQRLRVRVNALFERIETQFKQVLRERSMREGKELPTNEAVIANLFSSWLEGQIRQFVRSEFKHLPSKHLAAQWQLIQKSIFA